MKKRFLASLLLLTLLLVGCTETVADHSSAEPDTQSSADVSSEESITNESSADISADVSDNEFAETDTEDLFTYMTHQPPFELSTIYQELQRRADGRAVVCSYEGLDESTREVWNYKFVEMPNGPQALKDSEDTIIPQDAPYMKNIWLENFVIFPDGTVYGTYTPSVSRRVAEVCKVDTNRDYGTIFSVDASKYNISYE
ncbi:MAG: hypothetical protein IJD82_00185, partial [Clostridia bacterium]|nr:hypothetical protein [Clostridia bacterium]